MDAAAVVASLGAVPIPKPPPAEPTPVALEGHPQLLAMGAPVRVTLKNGTTAIVTALGPRTLRPYTGGATLPTSTPGVITLDLRVTTGNLAVTATDLTSRDQSGHSVPLTARGAGVVQVPAGSRGTLEVMGTYRSGSAQVTWRHDGHVLGVWVFTIELD